MRKNTGEESTLALKPRADIRRSSQKRLVSSKKIISSTPSAVLFGGYPFPDQGYPVFGQGVPHPWPGGTSSLVGGGTPSLARVPPIQTWAGYPPRPDLVGVPLLCGPGRDTPGGGQSENIVTHRTRSVKMLTKYLANSDDSVAIT